MAQYARASIGVFLFFCCFLTTGNTAKSSPTFIAFSVGKTQHQLGAGRVRYEKVFLNIGNAYSTTHNAFVTPSGGVYEITVSALNHIQSENKTELFLDLYKNTEYLISVYESKQVFGQGSTTILLQLLPGDYVFVQSRNAESGLYGTSDQVYCTFSGHLIVPIYQVTTYIAGVVVTDPKAP